MPSQLKIAPAQQAMLLEFLERRIPGVAVWAYGSRVSRTARPNADLTLVAFSSPEDKSRVAALRDEIAESDLPFLVDLQVWDEIPERLHANIRRMHVVLQEANGEPAALNAQELHGG